MARGRIEIGTPIEGKIGYLQGNVLIATLAATFQMPDDSPVINVFNPNVAARNVELPANPREGQMHIIINSGTNVADVITLLTDAGVALAPASTLAQNKRALVVFANGLWWAFVGANA